MPVLRELPSYAVGSFNTAGAIRAALAQHERGQFSQSANLVDAMMRDTRVAGAMRTRVQTLLGLKLDMEPQGDGRKKKAVAKEALETWPSMFPEDQLSAWVTWGLLLGYGIGQNVVDTTAVPGRWLPRLRVWHPQYAYWDWDERCLMLNTQDGVVPIRQDDPEWCVYAPYGYERGWMGAIVRSVADAWLMRTWARRDWARYSEVHGQPIKLAITPSGGDEEEKERWHRTVANPGAEMTYRVTDGGEGNKFDLQFREPVAKSVDAFQGLIEVASADISIAILGHNLTSEVKGGSYAAAKVGDNIRSDLKEFDANTVANALRAGSLKRWAKWNFDDAELAPTPKWETEQPPDEKAAADTLVSFAAAISALKAANVNPDVERLCEEFGIPSLGIPSPEEEQAAKEEARANAPPPPPPAPVRLVPGQKPNQPTDAQAGEPSQAGGTVP
jgi:phage gp29-like protein